jgi:hypothetical protein
MSSSSVYELIQRGALPCHRVGPRSGAIRISVDDLESYLRRCRHEAQGDERAAHERVQLKHLRV